MKIVQMRTNHLTNPLGYHLGTPCVSWVVTDTTAIKQAAACVTVAADIDFSEIIYTTGKRPDISSLCCNLPIPLQPYTRYYWRVQVWADNGETALSVLAFFETAKLTDRWKSSWITPDLEKSIHPYLRKAFTLPDQIESARAYVCGLGLYELMLNGKKVEDEYLSPGFHSYDFWLQYQTYDITKYVKPGENAVGALLGNGWYKGRFGFDGGYTDIYGDSFLFLCEIAVKLTDGTTLNILSDGSWKSHESPVVDSSIYDGEIYDANKEISRWAFAGYNDRGWAGVSVVNYGYDKLTERSSLPVRIKEKRNPIEVIHTPAGETVLDFGQNMAGWVEFACDLPRGAQITLQYGEVLQNGNFYNENLRTAKAEFTYISDGKKAKVRPHFTYYGFRYVKLTGFCTVIDRKHFKACVLYSDLAQCGEIKTSNPLVNQLFQNALWGQKGNFLDVPTDCPQRDERMGWTGDAQIFAATASFNMDTPAFYTKYTIDIAKEQKALDGSVPFVAPLIKPKLADGQKINLGHGSCAWGDVATVLPWTLYLFYGDKHLLAQQYPIMKAWVDYIMRQDDADGSQRLWKTGFHFADWLALDNDDPNSPFGGTDPYFIASAYYSYSAELTAKAAKALGKTSDEQKYSGLSAEIKKAIQKEYFTLAGDCKIETQTALVVSLFMNLIPESFRNKLVDSLKEKLRANNMHLNTGFVGTPYLCRVLSDSHANDYAYTLLLNEDYPSWLYEVKLGATTVWERWNSLLDDGSISSTGMNSLNHYAYGSIAEWMYRDMCGINPVEDAPGFKKILLRPRPDKRLSHANASYNSPSGLIESGWKITKSGNITYRFVIPFDTQATAVLRKGATNQVNINGVIQSLEANSDVFTLQLTAGEYHIDVT